MLNRISKIVSECDNFLITSHIKPDGDGIGSVLALYHALRGLGKKAIVYNQDPVPEVYGFLPGSSLIRSELGAVEDFGALFILDCSDPDRIGVESERFKSIKYAINIDHHLTNGGFTDFSLLDPGASSTGELVFKLLKQLNVVMTPDIAINLYTAIITDTGSFRYSNTGSEALRIAGELVKAGVEPQYVAEKIYESTPLSKARLFAKALRTLKIACEGRIASITVLREIMEEAGAKSEHTENFVDYARSIEGIEVGILYTEIDDNYFKVSLRSKGRINVEVIARRFRRRRSCQCRCLQNPGKTRGYHGPCSEAYCWRLNGRSYHN